MKIYFAICFFLCSSLAQGQVTFSEESQVKSLMDLYEATGKSEEHINGWRIKLVSTTDYRELDRIEYKFSQQNSGLPFKSEYENPYYSLKVGAFESRFDLEPVLVRLKRDFRGALPFRDKILKSELYN